MTFAAWLRSAWSCFLASVMAISTSMAGSIAPSAVERNNCLM